MTAPARYRRAAEAASNPQPGDYWHEMFSAACIVIARSGPWVCVADDPEPAGDNHYRFSRLRWQTVASFERWLRYNSIPGYWADVVRGVGLQGYLPPPPLTFDSLIEAAA